MRDGHGGGGGRYVGAHYGGRLRSIEWGGMTRGGGTLLLEEGIHGQGNFKRNRRPRLKRSCDGGRRSRAWVGK